MGRDILCCNGNGNGTMMMMKPESRFRRSQIRNKKKKKNNEDEDVKMLVISIITTATTRGGGIRKIQQQEEEQGAKYIVGVCVMFLIGAVASHCHDDNGSSIEPRLKENRQATTAAWGRPISLFTTTHC